MKQILWFVKSNPAKLTVKTPKATIHELNSKESTGDSEAFSWEG